MQDMNPENEFSLRSKEVLLSVQQKGQQMEDFYETHEQDDLRDHEEENVFRDTVLEREEDDDPQCVCGWYRSEHMMGGCRQFQTAEQWEREKEWLQNLSDEDYDRIYPDGGDY